MQGLGRGLGPVATGGVHSPFTFSFGGPSPSPSFTSPGLGWPQQATAAPSTPSFNFGDYAPPPHDGSNSGNGGDVAHIPPNPIFSQQSPSESSQSGSNPLLRGMGRGTHMARPAWMEKN